MNKNILITGANGFIGSFLVEEALERGFKVFAAVRKNSSTTFLKQSGATLVETDYHSVDSLTQVLKQNNITHIIHNAGLTKSPSPAELIRVNKELLVNLVEAIRQSEIGLSKLVFVSSLAAYGPADKQPGGIVKDSSTPHPVTHYGESKLAAESYLRQQKDIPYVIIRPTAVYGPREKDMLNVFQLINKRLNLQPAVLGQKLTFIYVKDLVRLIMLAAEKGAPHKAYFATDGHVYTGDAFPGFVSEYLKKRALKVKVPLIVVKSLAFITEKVSGMWDSYPIFNVNKVNELKAKNWNCDVSNLEADLGFRAEYDLTRGIPETIEWYKENKWL